MPPYFPALPKEAVSLREYADGIGKRLDEAHSSGARIGPARAFELCTTPEGEVRGALIGYDEPDGFVDSTPAKFTGALLQLVILLETIGATEYSEEAAEASTAAAQALRTSALQAFTDTKNWWPLVLEDIRARLVSHSE